VKILNSEIKAFQRWDGDDIMHLTTPIGPIKSQIDWFLFSEWWFIVGSYFITRYIILNKQVGTFNGSLLVCKYFTND